MAGHSAARTAGPLPCNITRHICADCTRPVANLRADTCVRMAMGLSARLPVPLFLLAAETVHTEPSGPSGPVAVHRTKPACGSCAQVEST